MSENIWALGPKELIEHGNSLIESGKDSDLRIAMICVDNAVELMIKSYFALNKRTLGIKYQDYKNNIKKFPLMLNLLQSFLGDVEVSLDELDKIECFHVIRNNLYHQGSGISVIKSFVIKYILLAQDLLSRLFKFEFSLVSDDLSKKQGEFLQILRNIEVNLGNYALTENLIPLISKPYTLNKIMSILLKSNKITHEFNNGFTDILKFRNDYVHGVRDVNIEVFDEKLTELKQIDRDLIDIMNS